MAPTPKKARMTNEVVSTAYCKAYLYEISWKKMFSDQIAGFLNKYAELKNTTIDIVSAMLLSNTAALLGPQTVIKFNEHQKLKANYYMIVVAERGLGKTPAYEELCYKPIETLQNAVAKKFKIDDFTRAGLMCALEKNNGYLYVCADEFGHTIDSVLQSESSAFRKNLNQCFSGTGYTKDFASRASVSIKSTCLSIMGTTQPGKYLEVMQRLHEVDDGLADRFLAISCPTRKPANNTYVDFRAQMPQDWPNDLARSIYDDHQGNGIAVEYTFTAEAVEYFQSLRAAAREATDEVYARLEEYVQKASAEGAESTTNAVDAALEAPSINITTKDGDLALKIAVAIHVTRAKLEALLRGTLNGAQVPTVVNADTLKTAIALVQALRMQSNEYRVANDTLVQAPVDANPSAVVRLFLSSSDRPIHLHRLILICPGRAITSRVVCRRNRKVKAEEVVTMMDQLASDPATSCYGMYRKIRGLNRHESIHVFYKAPVDNVSDEALEGIGISRAEYRAAYEADMSRPPCSGVSNWNQYYAHILAHYPAFSTSASPEF